MTLGEQRRVVVTTLASGAEVALCLHELQGTLGPGPTVGICAAIHGNEPTGTQIVLEVARRFAGGNFRGRLLLLPVANPLAFEANSRHTPVDDQNLNRLFPGNWDGWVSEQLAAAITEEFLTKIDVLIDLHSGVPYPVRRNHPSDSRGHSTLDRDSDALPTRRPRDRSRLAERSRGEGHARLRAVGVSHEAVAVIAGPHRVVILRA